MNDQPKHAGEQRTQCPCCGQIIPTQKELAQPKSKIRRGEPTGEPQESAIPGWNVDGTKRKPTGEWTRDGTLIYNGGKLVTDVAADHNAALAAHLMEMEAVTMNTSDIKTVEQLRKQLAAEREKVTLATQMVQIESKRANEAQQKVQMLVDALKDIRVGAPDIVKQQIKDRGRFGF